ncbi:cytochrome b [Mesorhizobium sp. J428]|uniref:cytochrome b n=1 Tax=Mesorhizobium sp. J428 TaxID=2898440 RepID=UPI002151A463|nr:cytochrome b [Mesorhizobium sp. J428]MCR5855615.1 cytochrome b [Mesorhizobium sp. J428]
MALKSDAIRYGSVARTMHWVTAVAILAMVGSGLAAESASGEAGAVNILRFHVVTGVAVLALTVLRILWWVLADTRPADTAATPRWQALAAHGVHYAFYLIILLLGGSGIGTIVLSGAGSVLFGAGEGALPDFENFAPRGPHGLFAWLLIGLVALHVAAAFYHQFALRDRLLGRMGLGRA